MPIFYRIPFLVTPKEAVVESGFDLTKTSDYLRFAEEIARYSSQPGVRSIFSTPIYGRLVLPLRTVHGGIRALIPYAAAIRNNIPNQQNAYGFIKIMPDDEIIRIFLRLAASPDDKYC